MLKNKIKAWQYMILVYIFGFFVMFFSHASDKNDWLNKHFEGEVIKKITTNNHALDEFTIKNGDNTVIIIDRFWKMTDYQVGDNVIKVKGSSDVIRKSQGDGKNSPTQSD